MVRNIFMAFIGLVILMFVIRYPNDVVGLLNLFVTAASKIANALQSLVHSAPSTVNNGTAGS